MGYPEVRADAADPRRGRQAMAVAAGVLGVGLALSACGSSKTSAGSASGAVDSAVAALGQQSSLSVTLSLPITTEQATQLSAKSGGTPMTPAEAKALTSGSIFFYEQTGHGEGVGTAQAHTDSANSYDFGLRIGSDTPLEIRYVGQNLFARVQIPTLLTDIGQSASKGAGLQSELNQLNSLMPGVSALGQGDWVEATHAGLESLAPILKQLEGSAGMPSASQLMPAFAKLRTDAVNALGADSTFASTGSSGGVTDYSVTVQVAKVLDDLAPQVKSTLGSLPGFGSRIDSGLAGAQKSIPANQTAVIDLAVAGGKLQKASLDLNQFAGKDKVDFAVPLQAAFGSPGVVSAPAGATQLDVSKLPALLQNLLTAGLHGGATPQT